MKPIEGNQALVCLFKDVDLWTVLKLEGPYLITTDFAEEMPELPQISLDLNTLFALLRFSSSLIK